MKTKLTGIALTCLAILGIYAALSYRSALAAPTPWPEPPYSPTVINFSGSGDNTVVTGVAGQGICVYAMFFTAGGATNITIKDGANTSFTGPMSFATNGAGWWNLMNASKSPWFITGAGNNFVINSSSAVQVSGAVYAQPCP